MSGVEFNEMLENNAEALRPFAFTLTRDHDKAKDLFQETLYRALANREKYNVGTNIKAWLYTIMRNIFINNYRKKSRQVVVLDNGQEDYLVNINQRTVANDAITRLNLKEVKQAIHGLPEIFRYPFVLYFEGYKYNEIAGMLREPLGTVKSRIHFARRLLKNQVERY
jgi:RNA polymerase sigma-70 factor (ECF subfamily)